MAKKPKLKGLQKYWPSLTVEGCELERQKLFKKQGGCCAICKKPESYFKNRLAVDHNHRNGQVRGLLCFYCNRILVARHTAKTAFDVYQYLLRYVEAKIEEVSKSTVYDKEVK